MNYRRMHHGFTLIEIIVSLGILAMLGLVLTQSFVTSVRTTSKGEITQEVMQNGNLAVETVSRMILNATNIDSLCTVSGTTSSSLVLTNNDTSQSTISCVSNSGVLRIASTTTGVVSYLTSDALTLSGATCSAALTFTCQVIGDANKKIHMSFSLSQKDANAGAFDKASSPFELTVTTRN